MSEIVKMLRVLLLNNYLKNLQMKLMMLEIAKMLKALLQNKNLKNLPILKLMTLEIAKMQIIKILYSFNIKCKKNIKLTNIYMIL